MSVPITLSDLERREAIGRIFFWWIYVVALVPYGATKFDRITQVEERRISRGLCTAFDAELSNLTW